jgi:hypothetical protein
MQTGNGYTSTVIKPHNDAAPLRVYTSVFGACDRIPVAASGHYQKRFERTRFKQLTDIGYHLTE